MTPSPSPPPPHLSTTRTLLDIIRDEDPHGSLFGRKDKKSWKTLTDCLRLRRARAAWTSSVPIPASDIPIYNNNNFTLNSSRSLLSRHGSVRFITVSSVTPSNTEDSPSLATSRNLMNPRVSRPTDSREANIHLPLASSFRPQMSRHNSTHVEVSEECEEERDCTQRPATVLPGDEDSAEVRMSLMDLLEETEGRMGFVGSIYKVGEEEEEEEDDGGLEQRCCVCMVRHKGAALIPCGHTFCRLCSRELLVQRGNCPLCNAFIREVLDIF